MDKSIAVLPFHNDSPDKENDYFINGTMEDILDNLCKIKDLRVISRTSVEQYRNNTQLIPAIAKDLRVSYILEGSMQKYENSIKLTVQLIDSKDSHIWSKTYRRELNRADDYFAMQSEIAELIAVEIKVVITPGELELIEKIPTVSLSANEYYKRGKQEIINYYHHEGGHMALESAREMFYKALEHDSTFAKAYAGLAEVAFYPSMEEEIFAGDYLDTVLAYVNTALYYDDKIAEAYHLRAFYYWNKEKLYEKALDDLNKALELNPNDDEIYDSRGNLLFGILEEYTKGIVDFEMAIERNSGAELSKRISRLARCYNDLGFYNIGKYYSRQRLNLDGDSAGYYNALRMTALLEENLETVFELEEKIREFRPQFRVGGWLGVAVGNNDVIIQQVKEELEQIEREGTEPIYSPYFIGYGLWLMGEYERAEYYFDLQIKNSQEILALNRDRPDMGNPVYNMLLAAAFSGRKELAINCMEDLSSLTLSKLLIALIRLNPMIEPIRDDPRYKELMQIMLDKFHAAHEEVREWLEETGRMEQFNQAN